MNIEEQRSENDFLVGDSVVINNHHMGPYVSEAIFYITELKEDFLGGHVSMIDSDGKIWTSGTQHLRHATLAELKVKCRLPEPIALFFPMLEDIKKYYQRAMSAQGEIS